MARTHRFAAAREASRANERPKPRDAGPAAQTSADPRWVLLGSVPACFEVWTSRIHEWLRLVDGARSDGVKLVNKTIFFERGVRDSRTMAVWAFDSPSITSWNQLHVLSV